MADLPPNPGPDDNVPDTTRREPPSGTPLWVKVFGVVIIGLVALLVIMMLAGGHTSPVRH